MFKMYRNESEFSKVKINPELPVFCDTETMKDEGLTSGGLYGKVRLVQIFQTEWENAIIVDCEFIELDKVLNLLHPHFLIWHNASYDIHTINLYTKEMWWPRKVGDTSYLSRLKYYTKERFDFYSCLEYSKNNDELIDNIDKKEEQKSDWSGPLSRKQKMYAAADVVYLAKLYESVKSEESRLVYRLDIQNLEFAVKYTRTGMPVNQKTVKKLIGEYIVKLEDTLDQLPINPRSSKQACSYLGTSSSSSDVLTDMMMKGSERATLVSNGRHYYKSLEYLRSYDRPWIKGFFQPCTALSGRFSCSGGHSFNHCNLQQIPEVLHEIVEAPEEYVIIYKDYSGLELRMSVAYTGEPVMSRLMMSGADMHTETAKYIFSTDEPTDEQRVVAKTCNFALIYGAGIKRVKETLYLKAGINMPFNQVKELRENWFSMYEYFTEWHKIHKNQMNVTGYIDVETALGRKVRTYRLTDSLNLPIQGSSVEVQKVALGYLWTRYPDVNLINTIHDSNILLSRKEEVDKWGNRLDKCMIDAWKYVIAELPEPEIPMPSGFEAGPIWIFH